MFSIQLNVYTYFRLPSIGCRLLLRILGVSYEVRGIENIQHERGGVVLVNHQSGIDLAGKQKFLFSFVCKC